MKSATDRLRDGDGSEFDKSIAALERMHECLLTANTYRHSYTIGGLRTWYNCLVSLDVELSPAYNERDKEELSIKRVPEWALFQTNANKIIQNLRSRLLKYEIALRQIHQNKGYNVRAKEDMARAMADDMKGF